MSQREVAKQLGISRARVAQIEKAALTKIRKSGKMDKFLCLLRQYEEYYGEEHQALRHSKT